MYKSLSTPSTTSIPSVVDDEDGQDEDQGEGDVVPETPKDAMYFDCQSKLALQVFAMENHPSVYKQGNSRKEGLSLFALFNRCASRIGSAELKKIFNQPIYNVVELNERLDFVQYFYNNATMVEGMKSCLKGVQDTTSVVEKMRYADCNVSDWARLLKTIKHIEQVYKYLIGVKEDFPIAIRFIELFANSKLSLMIDLIEAVVDFKESRTTGKFEVNKGLDSDLDELKATFAQLPDIMYQHGTREFSAYQDRIASCQITYATHLGFHLQVPLTPSQIMTNNYRIAGLEFKYRVGESGFYKSPMTHELDETFGDILIDITEKQRKILLELQLKVLDGIDALAELTNLCAKIDAFIAIAETSVCFKYKRPVFNVNDEIDIEEGRHPLQELFVNSYVTNDSRTGNQEGKIRIITGPNASGKSVFLKQMALIVYMAHIGSFVPAYYANIGALERIMTRIKTTESISSGLSSYILDLKQTAPMTQERTDNSLFIVDELGKGTDPISGISLLSALINYFASAENVPHVFVATHFLTIKEHLNPSPHISFWTLDVKLEGDDVIYQFKLIPGRASSSRASLVIKAAGLADRLLKRTEEIEDQLRKGGAIIPRPNEHLQELASRLTAAADKFDSTNFDAADFDGQKFLQSIMPTVNYNPIYQQLFQPQQSPFKSPALPPPRTPAPSPVQSPAQSPVQSPAQSLSGSSCHSSASSIYSPSPKSKRYNL